MISIDRPSRGIPTSLKRFNWTLQDTIGVSESHRIESDILSLNFSTRVVNDSISAFVRRGSQSRMECTATFQAEKIILTAYFEGHFKATQAFASSNDCLPT